MRELLRNGIAFPMTSCDETEMYGEAWRELKRLGADDVLIKGMNMQESLMMKVGGLLGRK